MRNQAGSVLVRLFNASSDGSPGKAHYHRAASKVELVQLSGEVVREIPIRKEGEGVTFELALPKFGIGTLRITL